jgi:hypothetical protein
MNEIIKGVKDIEVKYSMENNTIQILYYATLFEESEDDLQRLLHRFATIISTFNMSISIEKIQTHDNSQKTNHI